MENTKVVEMWVGGLQVGRILGAGRMGPAHGLFMQGEEASTDAYSTELLIIVTFHSR